jgi:hypothetical protein
MNYRAMSYDEASFTLFAFKRCLRDRDGLTPAMVQFYERSIEVLAEKLPRLERESKDQRPYGDQLRDRNSQVPTVWPNN